MSRIKFWQAFLTLTGITLITGSYLLKLWPDQLVHVVFCDVGQGDGVLITYQFTQVLIDSGSDSKVLQCLQKHLPFSDKKLEVVIATHPDSDHIGGFPAVFRQYRVSHFFALGIAKDTQDFSRFRSSVIELRHQGTRVHLAKAGQEVIVNQHTQLTVLSPDSPLGSVELFSSGIPQEKLSVIAAEQQDIFKSVNDLSIATFLKVGHFTHLLMADVELEGENALLSKGKLPDVDVLKAGHHGSKTSSSKQLLEITRPEFVVISAGRKNRYGHPHQEVLERFKFFKSKVLRTDQQGDIEWISDGKTFRWKTQHSQ